MAEPMQEVCLNLTELDATARPSQVSSRAPVVASIAAPLRSSSDHSSAELSPQMSGARSITPGDSRGEVSRSPARSPVPALDLDKAAKQKAAKNESEESGGIACATSSSDAGLSEVAAEGEILEDDKAERLRRETPIATQVLPYLFVGGEVAARDRDQLLRCGITHVVNAAALAIPCHFPDLFAYVPLCIGDSPEEDINALFPIINSFIDEAARLGGRTLVHCHQGVSRSCTLVLAYIMWKNGWTYEEAYRFVRARRTICSPNPGFFVRLLKWEALLSSRYNEAITLSTHQACVEGRQLLLAWKYLPYSEEHTFPPCLKQIVPPFSETLKVIDPRTCYAFAIPNSSEEEGRRLLFVAGYECSDDTRESATYAFETLLKYGFYTQPQITESKNHKGETVVFCPNDFFQSVPEEIILPPSDDPRFDISVARLEDELRAVFVDGGSDQAAKRFFVVEHDRSMDVLLADAMGNSASAEIDARRRAKKYSSAREGARKTLLQQLDTGTADATLAPSEHCRTSPAASPPKQPQQSSSSEDVDATADPLSVFLYPFTEGPLDIIDLDDLGSSHAYALFVRGREDAGRAPAVYVWLGNDFEGAPEVVLEQYQKSFLASNMQPLPRLASIRPSVIREGEEPDDLLCMFQNVLFVNGLRSGKWRRRRTFTVYVREGSPDRIDFLEGYGSRKF